MAVFQAEELKYDVRNHQRAVGRNNPVLASYLVIVEQIDVINVHGMV